MGRRPGTDSAVELGALLAGINRLVRRQVRESLHGPYLLGAQAELLRLVSERPGIRVSAAARELRLAGNSVSTLVRQLAAVGLLVREPDPRDRRAALLTVTPEADRRLRAWEDHRAALLTDRFDQLPTVDRAALVAALPALRTLAARLHEEVL
ncbi:MarR family winged helix-turn-helix transcriptional regulator [Streptomyces sp. NPDC094448]|uniref:MarR family winged helix-turn-helix transcriptional regulator n=1 Tax=Streptomyces sp. NPDC094448 TaxID=3366063 RepID=UPI00381C6BAD